MTHVVLGFVLPSLLLILGHRNCGPRNMQLLVDAFTLFKKKKTYSLVITASDHKISAFCANTAFGN